MSEVLNLLTAANSFLGFGLLVCLVVLFVAVGCYIWDNYRRRQQRIAELRETYQSRISSETIHN